MSNQVTTVENVNFAESVMFPFPLMALIIGCVVLTAVATLRVLFPASKPPYPRRVKPRS